MKRLDRFILKSFIGPFFMILFIVVFILMMQFLWLYIDELVGKGLSFGVIMEFLGWGSCTMLPLSLPLATLLASMMTLGAMGENNELLAIKASGISLQRVLVPLTIVSALISVGAFFAANDLIPVAYNKIYTLREDIGRTKDEIKIPVGVFYNGVDGYTLRIDSRDKESGMMYGVMVYNHTSNKGNTSLTIADSGAMKMSPDKSYLIFNLYNGISYDETNTRKYKDTTYQLQQIDFDVQELVIPLENYSFKKSEEGKYANEVNSMNLKTLFRGRDSIGAHFDSTVTDQKTRLVNHHSLKYLKQMDTANAKSIRSVLDYDSLKVCQWKDLPQERDAIQKAISKMNDRISLMTTFSRETYNDLYLLRRIRLGILQKFALAITCLMFFFIGAPLGAIIRKGGLGTPAIISILFFVLYWVIDISCNKLAKDGATTAWIGSFMAIFVLTPIGAFLTWKATNDSGFLDAEAIKVRFNKIINKFFGRLKKVKIVYMGTPEFAVAPLDALRKNGFKIAAVVTVADKASGRGLKINESAVKKYATEHKIPTLQPTSLKDPQFLEQLRAINADMFVVVAFRMLPKEVWAMPRLGTFNLHASLLPQYRGAAPINWAIINGEKFTGVTTFLIDENIDTGHVILQEQIRIEDQDDAGTLHDKLMETGARLTVRTAELLYYKKAELQKQSKMVPEDVELMPAPKLTRELARIDFSRDGHKTVNLIRGLSPYPGAFFEFTKNGSESTVHSMKVFKAAFEPHTSETFAALGCAGKDTGDFVSDGKHLLGIRTADGVLLLKDIQMSGKKRMETEAFLLGFREPESYKVIR